MGGNRKQDTVINPNSCDKKFHQVGGEAIPERKWISGIGGQFYHLKKRRTRRRRKRGRGEEEEEGEEGEEGRRGEGGGERRKGRRGRRRNSRQAETRDIYTQCSSSSMNLPLGNNQMCEGVIRLFIRELFIILQNQKELKCSIITGQLNK